MLAITRQSLSFWDIFKQLMGEKCQFTALAHKKCLVEAASPTKNPQDKLLSREITTLRSMIETKEKSLE